MVTLAASSSGVPDRCGNDVLNANPFPKVMLALNFSLDVTSLVLRWVVVVVTAVVLDKLALSHAVDAF